MKADDVLHCILIRGVETTLTVRGGVPSITPDAMKADSLMEKGYDLFGLYHDADDPRVIVPKRVKALGWTVNVSSTGGRVVLGSVVLIIAGLAVWQYG